MRLWVLLDEKENKNIRSDDIVLTTKDSGGRSVNKGMKTIFVNYGICDEKEYAAIIVNDLFASLPKNLCSFKNKFYMSIVRPLCAVIFQIDSIINSFCVDEIILVGGAEYPFLSCINTNGEGVRTWYRTSWLMNSYIHSFLQNKYPNILVIWKRKRNPRIQLINNIIREHFYLVCVAIRELYRIIKKKNDSTIKTDDYAKIESAAIIHINLQLIHLGLVLHDYCKTNVMIIENSVDSNLVANCFIDRIQPNSFSDTFRLYLRTKKIPKAESIRLMFGSKSYTVEKRSVYRALFSEILLHSLRFNSFTRELRKYPNLKTIFTDGTFGTDMILCHEYAVSQGIKHINYQHVTMNKMYYPIVDLADDYYLFAKGTYDLYHALSKTYKFYLPNYREPKRGDSMQLVISVFLQPDSYEQRYESLLSKLIPVFNSFHFVKEVIIKPHYRQIDIHAFERMVEKQVKFRICSKGDNATEIIKNSDIIISISSSVLFEAIFYGTPGLILDLDRKEKTLIFSNDSHGKEVNYYVDNVEDVKRLLLNYNTFFDEYCYKREAFYAIMNKKAHMHSKDTQI